MNKYTTYLGDGVYAEIDNGDVCLYTSNGETRTNEIILEISTLDNFLVWLRDLKGKMETINN